MLREGNKEAEKAYWSFVYYVSFGVVNIIHMLDPGLLIIGGGLMEQGFVVEDIKREVKKKVLPFYKTTEIKSAKLGNSAGLYGAAYIALK